jgi:hypothetical protein
VGLREDTDSDGDRVFRLELQRDDGGREELDRTTQEPIELRQLARWLAARTGVGFADEATPEKRAEAAAARTAAQAALKQAARAWLASWLGRGGKR